MLRIIALALCALGPAAPQEAAPALPRGTGATLESLREFDLAFTGASGDVEYTLQVVRHDILRLYIRDDGSIRRRVIVSTVSHRQVRPSGDGAPPALSSLTLRAPAEQGFPLPTSMNARDYVHAATEFRDLEGRALPVDVSRQLSADEIPEDRLLALLPERVAAGAAWSPKPEAVESALASRELLPSDLLSPFRTAIAALKPAAKATSRTNVDLSGGNDGTLLKGSLSLHAGSTPVAADILVDTKFPLATRTIEFSTRIRARARVAITWGAMSEERIGRVKEQEWFLRLPTVGDYQSMTDDGGPRYLRALELSLDGNPDAAFALYWRLLQKDRLLQPSTAFGALDLWFGRLARRLGRPEPALLAFKLAAASGSMLDLSAVPLECAETRLQLGPAATDALLADLAAYRGTDRHRVDYLHGRALAARGDWAGAAKRFESASSGAVSDAPLHRTWLAIAKRELGDLPAALEAARAVLAKSPTFRPARTLALSCAAAVTRKIDVIVAADELVPLSTWHLLDSGDARPLPALVHLRLLNLGAADLPVTITLSIRDVATDFSATATLPPGRRVDRDLTPVLKLKIDRVDAERRATATVTVRHSESKELLFESELPLRLLPRGTLVWRRSDPELGTPVATFTRSLAALVTPGSKAVAALLADAGFEFKGMAAPTRPQARALFDVFRKRLNVRGENALIMEGSSALLALRLPFQAAAGDATPLEASLLYISLLEAAGLQPFLASVAGRPIVGWRASEADPTGPPEIYLDLDLPEGRTFEEAVGAGSAALQAQEVVARRTGIVGDSWTLDLAALRRGSWLPLPAADLPEKEK